MKSATILAHYMNPKWEYTGLAYRGERFTYVSVHLSDPIRIPATPSFFPPRGTQQLPLHSHASVSSRPSPLPPSPAAALEIPVAGHRGHHKNAPRTPRRGGDGLRGASTVIGRAGGVPSPPLPPRAGLGSGGGEVALLRPGGAELRRSDRGSGARGARRGDPAQAALPRRRLRPLSLRPREGLRSRYAASHTTP
jgi:hypothetical protein